MKQGRCLLILLAVLALPLMAGDVMAQTITLNQIQHQINDGGNGIQAGDTITFTFNVGGDEFTDFDVAVWVETPGYDMSFPGGPYTLPAGSPPNTINIVGIYTITGADILAKQVALNDVQAVGDTCGECYSYSSPQNYTVDLPLPATVNVNLWINDGNPATVGVRLECTDADPSVSNGTGSLGSDAVFNLLRAGPNNTCAATVTSFQSNYDVESGNFCTEIAAAGGSSATCYIDIYYEAVDANIQRISDAAEPDQDGAFRITLSGSPPYYGMDVVYQLGGTATEGEDYENIGTIFMAYGSTSQTVNVTVIDDEEIEDNETVIMTLLEPDLGCQEFASIGDRSGGTGGGGYCFDPYHPGTNDEATVTIEDNDAIATFTVYKWFEDGNPASVQVTLNCTDATPSVSTQPASQNSPAVFSLTDVGSGNSCTATENVPSGYQVSYYNCSSVSLPGGSQDYCYIDNYYIPVTAQITQQSNAAEPNQDGSFQVSLSGGAPFGGMEVNFTVAGTAEPDEDYVDLGSSVIIPFGSTSQQIPVDVIDDNLFEETETVIVTLQAPDTGNCESSGLEIDRAGGGKPGTEEVCDGYEVGTGAQATVEILDDDKPLVALEAIEDAAEPDSDGSFRLFLAVPAPAGGVTVKLLADGSATAGVDYTRLPNEVSFAEGETSMDLVVAPIDDSEIEETEEVRLFIVPDDAYSIASGSSPAKLSIFDDDVVEGLSLSIAATSSTAEPSGTGVFTVSLSEASDSDTAVSLTLGGTATAGVDYVEPVSPVVIAAGALSATVNIVVIDDELVEETETVSVTIAAPEGIMVTGNPTATIDIEDDDQTPALSLSVAATSSTSEPSGTGVFTVSLSAVTESDTSVAFTLGGTATAGMDYQQPASPVVIAAGALSAAINIVVIDDEEVEGTETVSVTVSTESGIPIVGSATATINIEDNEQAPPMPGITVNPTSGLVTTEDGGTAQFSVVLDSEPTATVSIAMASSDTSEGTISPESLEFNSSNWNMARTVTVTGVPDDEVDGDVAYTIDLSPAVSSDSGYSGLDPADVSVVNQDTTVPEPDGGAEFTSPTYTVKEADGAASISIRRTGSTASALTVTFATDDENETNTAVAGEDYISTTIEVSWAAGEEDEKFVSVPVIENVDKDDGATESVGLTLSGATIEMQTATLEILSEPQGPPISPEDLPPNQQQVVKVINESCPQGNNAPDFQALCTAMVVTGSQLEGPLRETTADDAAVVRSSGMQTAGIQVTAVDGRIGTLRGGGGAGFSASGFSVGLGDMSLNGGLMKSFISAFDQNSPEFMQANANANDDDNFIDEFGRWGAWISGRVIMGDKDLTTNQLDYDFDTAGLTFGMDYRFSDSLIGGIAVGYANTDSDLGNNDGKVKTKGYSVSLYGTWFKSDSFYLGGSLGYGGNTYDHTRNVQYTIARPPAGNPAIDALPDWAFDVDQSFAADYDGRQYSAAISGGWDFSKNGWTFGPTFRIDWTSVDVDGYDEVLTRSNSGNIAQFGWAVRIDDQKYESLQPAIGFEFTKAVSASWGIFIPQGYIDVVSELSDDGILVTGRYLGDTNRVPFALETDDFTETYFRAGLGFGLVLKNNKSAFFMVDGDLGRDLLHTYYINAGFRWQF